MNPAVLVFEDEQVAQLHPVTTARPAYAVSCGSFRLIDWLTELDAPLGSAIRTYLHDIERADFPQFTDGSRRAVEAGGRRAGDSFLAEFPDAAAVAAVRSARRCAAG